MKDCLLITHQFIKNNSEKWKYDIFDFCINYYRENNPDTYIILTGHGLKPRKSTLEKVDWVYWQESIIKSDIGKGHPMLTTIGLQHAKEKGFEYVCKTRLDTINLIKNIVEFCDNKLKLSKKLILNIYAYDDRYQLMDLFIYSKTDVLLKLFNPNKWKTSWCKDGTGPVAQNYLEDINNVKIIFPFNSDFWKKELDKNCLIIDIKELKWIDLRLIKDLKNINLDNWKEYLWKFYFY